MKTISNQSFEGERPLFKVDHLQMEKIVIHQGESALKECTNIISKNCEFEGKYPFWHNENVVIENCIFRDGARAAIWYTKSMKMIDSIIEAPKMFRDIDGLFLQNVTFSDAKETLWYCQNLDIHDIKVKNGDYIFMHSSNIKIDKFELDGNYSFQYCKNVEIHNATINSKDAFWNTENVTVYDSVINSEYFAWHSKNLRLVNCKVSGLQPLCYCDDLVMENCTMGEVCNLCFEYSTIKAEIHSTIKSIKNPRSGKIVADHFDEIVIDENVRLPNDCILSTWDKEPNYRVDNKYAYFDQIVDRRGTNSYKWDSDSDPHILPMWVADMDFKTCPAVIDAIIKRAQHGVFGYTTVPDEYYQAVINWFTKRHNLTLKKDWILYTSGVVPAISAIIKAFTKPGDKVILQTPAYNCFFSCIRNNKCIMSENKLIYKDDTFYFDFDDLEKKASEPEAKLMILCNPHNPSGRVWHEDELRKVGEICIKHKVLVISDEIHCEQIQPGHKFISFSTISDEILHNTITCTSPSKAFNLGGLQISNIFSDNEEYRAKIDRALNDNEVCDVGVFGIEAVIAAYTKGEKYVDEMNDYLHNNYVFLCSFVEKNFPKIRVVKLEGTYLVWLNIEELHMSSEDLCNMLMDKEKLRINPGTMYGQEGFIRINIACTKRNLADGLERMKRVIVPLIKK
ncbi:hypothetical protein M9Y10_034676 [Tritrichomonas musculus]|uniref:cysteine-S-conjugate beta-lyase n=1 Tax=Tritrichomonas musculus TaxID=1915356 RepID=A0ABR2KGG1_9EUKA